MQTSIRGLSPQADGFRRHSNTEASVVGSFTNLTQCIPRVSPMRTASDYQTPAVPYHTLICRRFSTPNTALVRKNAEYITNTKYTKTMPENLETTRICARAQRAGKYAEHTEIALPGRCCAPVASGGRYAPLLFKVQGSKLAPARRL